MIWNRYTKKQTVHSVAPIPLATLANFNNVVLVNTPAPFKCPVFYHNNFFVVEKVRKFAACVCDKGERPIKAGSHIIGNCLVKDLQTLNTPLHFTGIHWSKEVLFLEPIFP